jgi:hypothetical protein
LSFLCCEDAGVYTSVCASVDVNIQEDITDPLLLGPLFIDLRRAPWRQMCLTVVAPLTFRVSGTTVFSATLTLFKGRSLGQADIVKVAPNMSVTVIGGEIELFTSVTPALLHKVPPGEYAIQISVSTSSGTVTSVAGSINASAVLSQLAVRVSSPKNLTLVL